ncbi:DNA repair protein rad2 [Coelomomyces lativittatus]|nr:DNA repair protein rad2 [Coelomomyces lativittatus]KAJ1511378.1 DNA repair protein rad2 [Coelomomyces lativittatus]KAJ1516067.1 DNA repair protein rad2 [Coelomomyces lativittatus]
MGVKHLWKLLEPAAQQVPLETLAYKTLAIDASIWLYQFIKIIYPVKNSTRSQSALDDENEFNVESPHILGFFHRICKLLYFGITPVFVFDGVPPKLKLETLAARRRKKEGASMDATKTAQQILHTQLKLTALNPHQLPKVTSLPHLKRKTTHDEFLLPLSTEFFDASWLTSQTIQDSRLPWLTSEIYPSSSSSSSHGLESDALLNEHQRLSQLRNESRRPSHQRLKTMLQHSKTPLDFSKQQLQHLVQRHKVTQQIHDLEKSGRKNQRIASDRSREYILVKNEDNEGKSLAGWRFQPATSSSPSFLTPNAPSVSKPNRDVPSKSSSLSSTWIPTSSSSSSSSSSTSLPLSLPSNAYFDHHALLQEDDDDDDDDDSENEDDELEFEVVPSLTLPSALQSLLPYLPSSFTQVFSLGTEMLMLALTWTTSQLHASYEACQKKIDQLTSTQDFKNPDWIAQFESYVFWEEYLDHVMAYQETHKKKVTSTFNPHDFGAPSPPPPSSSTTSQVSLNEPFPSTTRTCCMDPVDMKFDSLDAMDPQQRQRGQTLTTAFSEDDFKSSSDDLAFPPASIPKIVEPSMVKKINPSSLLLKRSKETVIHPTASSPTLAAPLPVLSSNETLKNDPGRTPHEHQTFSFLNEKVKEPFHAVSDVSTSFQNEGMTKSTILDTGSNSSVFHTVHEHYETQKTQQPVTEETQDEEGEEEEEEEEFEEITVNEPVPSTTSTSSNPIPMSTKMSPSLSESLSEPLSGSSLIPSLLTNSLVKDMNHPVVSKVQTPLPSSSPTSTPEQSSILPPVNNSSASSSSNTHASLTASMPSTSPAPPPTSPPSSLPSQLSPSNLFSHATMEPKPPSSSQKSINPVFDLRVELEKEQTHLVESYQKRTREASTIDNHLLEEVQCLLRYFGIPYIEAPSEAEAQCAYLSMTGVVHGVISDDSDVFLFGATHVYRHFFQDQKTVRLYKATTLTSKLGYSRTKLIDLAYLLGSDYTEGIPGIGPKTAQTLIQAFTSFSLHDIFNDPKRWPTYQSQLKPYTFPSSFPDPRVAQAYLHPDVLPLQPADVTWTAPQVPSLTTYLSEKLGWSLKKIQPMIAHVLHHYQQHTQHHQASLHFYYPLSQNTLSSENHRPSQLKRKKIKPKEEEEEGQSSASFQSREKGGFF